MTAKEDLSHEAGHLGEQSFNLLRWGDGVGTGLERKFEMWHAYPSATYCCIKKHTKPLGPPVASVLPKVPGQELNFTLSGHSHSLVQITFNEEEMTRPPFWAGNLGALCSWHVSVSLGLG